MGSRIVELTSMAVFKNESASKKYLSQLDQVTLRLLRHYVTAAISRDVTSLCNCNVHKALEHKGPDAEPGRYEDYIT